MKTPSPTPINQEREFRFSELFFSTTNKKGNILHGNAVFTRVAGYELDEMKGEPHSLVRHPDMPRSAFKLVWDYLNQGKMIAAYVKNLAKDGRYYWVIALIIPNEDGYLSIRLKPTSALLEHVQSLYAQTLKIESRLESKGRPSKEVMEAGMSHLVKVLGELGYDSYDAFMWEALAAEMKSREAMRRRESMEQQASDSSTPPTSTPRKRTVGDHRLTQLHQQCGVLDRQLGTLFSKLDIFSRFGEEVAPKAEFILRLGEQIRMISTNAEIQSSKLGDSGAALSMVAARLGDHSHAGAETISNLNEQIAVLGPTISDLIFNTIVSKLKIEMVTYFLDEITACQNPDDIGEDAAAQTDRNASITTLISSFLDSAQSITNTIGQLQGNLFEVNKEASKMSKFITTLNAINLIGKVETARSDATQTFSNIFDSVQKQSREAEAVLAEFLELIKTNTSELASIDTLNVYQIASLKAAA
jgi:aerotaxis receptor